MLYGTPSSCLTFIMDRCASASRVAPNLKACSQDTCHIQAMIIIVVQKAPFIPYFTTWDGQSNQSVFNVPLLGLPNLCDKDRPVPHHLAVGKLTPWIHNLSCLDLQHENDLCLDQMASISSKHRSFAQETLYWQPPLRSRD